MRAFPQNRLLAGQIRICLPNPSAVGRCYQLLLYSYILPQGQAPPLEEVSAPGPEGVQEIINRWKPFNRGKTPGRPFGTTIPDNASDASRCAGQGEG